MTTSPEEIAAYEDVYKQVRWWIIPPEEPEPDYYLPGTDIPYMTEGQHIQWQEYVYPVLIGGRIAGHEVDFLRREVHYSLLSDIREWFLNIRGLVWANQATGSTWLDAISGYLWQVVDALTAWLAAIRDAVQAELIGIANYVGNIYTWVVWNMVDDIKTFAINLFEPITDAWRTVTATLEYWFDYIYNAIIALFTDPIGWIQDALSEFGNWLGDIAAMVWDSMVALGDVLGAWLGTKLIAFAPLVVENLRDVLVYIWDTVVGGVGAVEKLIRDALIFWWEALKDAWIFVAEDMMPAVIGAASGAFGALKDEFTNLIGLAYDELLQKATALVPVTPERSAGIALGMFGTAVGFGALAHGMALAVEAIPNLKYMGTHYFSAFVARMGSFGTISSATMGVIAALAIREPFSYYMKSVLRPTQPREMDLQIMAVKPDISLETFRQGMKYQGYTDFWIDAFERTMFHEPSYFELSMLGEDEAATVDWLFTKARRSGYTEEDARVFVSSMIKKVTRDQRKEYYKQAFNAYKEGYISGEQFKEHLDHLDIRPEAKELATKAAQMAYQSDLNKELITVYRKSFSDDLTTEGEFMASLSALGLSDERAWIIVELEWVRKEPKILKAERKEIESQWRDIQSKYSRVYIESFRRGLITEGSLAAYLTAIGIKERAANATARYEAIKLVPKPKPLEIIIPQLPAPPEPPVYDI